MVAFAPGKPPWKN